MSAAPPPSNVVPSTKVVPKRHGASFGRVIGTTIIILIILIVIAVIVLIYLNWHNSTTTNPMDLTNQYYIMSTDKNGSTPLFPVYLNTTKTGFSLDIIPSTMWSITGVGNGTVNITDNRGVMFKSSNGYISDGSTETPPATSPSLTLAEKSGSAFNVSPYLTNDDHTKTGYTRSVYKLTSDINILYQDGGTPKLTNEDNIDSVTTVWWRFAPAPFIKM
jgi:hypothetical protein